MQRVIKNRNGFSLIELILALFVGTLLIGLTFETVINNVDSYAFQADRRSAMADARQALNRMSHELLRIESADISNITPTMISFFDEDNNYTDFRLTTNNGNLVVMRGSQILVDRVSSLTFNYYDETGTSITPDPVNINLVRQIEMSLSTISINEEGTITLTTKVTPRSFVGYSGYE